MLYSCKIGNYVRHDDLDFHKSTAADFGHFPKAHRQIKCNGLRRIIRCKFYLAHMAELVQNCPQESRSDALSLMLWEYQDILHKHDGIAIANSSDDAKKLIAIVSRQRQQGISKSIPGTASVIIPC